MDTRAFYLSHDEYFLSLKNKNSNFLFELVYFQICLEASAQPVENFCQKGV